MGSSLPREGAFKEAVAKAMRGKVQVDPSETKLLGKLRELLPGCSRASLIKEAVAVFAWLVEQRRAGMKVVAIDPQRLPPEVPYVELVTPSLSASAAQEYQWLVSRAHPWRKQLALKGRNIWVGHFVASMLANRETPQQAAEDYGISLEQVREALDYYQTHKELILAESREERRLLELDGYVVGSKTVPG